MSGDNNGRWAGSYDWPLDHTLYLSAMGDTISALRGHASLLLWCAGNELYSALKSPPPDIAAGLSTLVATLDPSARFLALSSASNWSDFDPAYALAPSDGPYGLRDERDWTQVRRGWDARGKYSPVVGMCSGRGRAALSMQSKRAATSCARLRPP